MENHSSDDEEDALEMERNFALLSKRSLMPTSAEDEEEMSDEDGSAEEDEAPEEDEDNGMDDEGDSGSDEDESVSDHGDEGGSKAQSHREGNIKSGKRISDLCVILLKSLFISSLFYIYIFFISLWLHRIINHVIWGNHKATE